MFKSSDEEVPTLASYYLSYFTWHAPSNQQGPYKTRRKIKTKKRAPIPPWRLILNSRSRKIKSFSTSWTLSSINFWVRWILSWEIHIYIYIYILEKCCILCTELYFNDFCALTFSIFRRHNSQLKNLQKAGYQNARSVCVCFVVSLNRVWEEQWGVWVRFWKTQMTFTHCWSWRWRRGMPRSRSLRNRTGPSATPCSTRSLAALPWLFSSSVPSFATL